MFTARSANPFQMPVAKGCCTWMGSLPLATSLPGILFPYSAKRHNLIFCIESFYRHTKSGIKNIGLNISFAASVATCNIHIALEPVHRYGGWLEAPQPAVCVWDRLRERARGSRPEGPRREWTAVE